MRAHCPNNDQHLTFTTVAHEMREWLVGPGGEFFDDLGCIEVTHEPHPENIWQCRTCGAQAIVEK